MTGRALFNEVFLTDARVADAAVIGGLNQGWAVANTTLANERAGLGSGGGSAAASVAVPGTVGGDLDRRAGDFVAARPARGAGKAGTANADRSDDPEDESSMRRAMGGRSQAAARRGQAQRRLPRTPSSARAWPSSTPGASSGGSTGCG